MADLRRRRDQAHGADIVELRLDGVADLDVAAALEGRQTRVIVTCRPTRQGGRYVGDEQARVAILERAWHLGADLVDVEFDAAEAFVQHTGGARIVRSYHDFVSVPVDARARLQSLLASGAQFAKLAAMTHDLADVATLASLGREAGGRAVVIGMGAAGVASRVLAAQCGSPWTYCGFNSAPGQLPLAEMRDVFRAGSISATTAVYGVVGKPVAHSLSPAMHNAAFRAAGLDAVYVPLAASSVADFETFAGAFPVSGVSVTAPYKLDAARLARASGGHDVGAVNTLRRTPSGWEGLNTDIAGFLAPLEGRSLKGTRASIIGAGGAARAVAAALVGKGAVVTLHARRAAMADAAAAASGGTTGSWPPPPEWDLLVNATPVGTAPNVDDTPVTLSGRLAGRLVYDLVYNPPETALVRQARQLGAEVIGGLPMLVAQAAAQFHWWTGLAPSVSAMHDAALARLAAAQPSEAQPL